MKKFERLLNSQHRKANTQSSDKKRIETQKKLSKTSSTALKIMKRSLSSTSFNPLEEKRNSIPRLNLPKKKPLMTRVPLQRYNRLHKKTRSMIYGGKKTRHIRGDSLELVKEPGSHEVILKLQELLVKQQKANGNKDAHSELSDYFEKEIAQRYLSNNDPSADESDKYEEINNRIESGEKAIEIDRLEEICELTEEREETGRDSEPLPFSSKCRLSKKYTLDKSLQKQPSSDKPSVLPSIPEIFIYYKVHFSGVSASIRPPKPIFIDSLQDQIKQLDFDESKIRSQRELKELCYRYRSLPGVSGYREDIPDEKIPKLNFDLPIIPEMAKEISVTVISITQIESSPTPVSKPLPFLSISSVPPLPQEVHIPSISIPLRCSGSPPAGPCSATAVSPISPGEYSGSGPSPLSVGMGASFEALLSLLCAFSSTSLPSSSLTPLIEAKLKEHFELLRGSNTGYIISKMAREEGPRRLVHVLLAAQAGAEHEALIEACQGKLSAPWRERQVRDKLKQVLGVGHRGTLEDLLRDRKRDLVLVLNAIEKRIEEIGSVGLNR